MTCTRYIDFSSPPYDESTVEDAYDEDGCSGVGDHFAANPINVGDCIEIDGTDYQITAVKVKCRNATVYSQGTPPSGIPPDHTQAYTSSPVTVELWLTPA